MSRIEEFQAKVSAKFEEISVRQTDNMVCKLGCHSCCKPNLSVSRVEAELIQQHLEKNPGVVEAIRENKGFHKGKRCEFLSPAGACQIYEVRPVICRSHGAPVQYRDTRNKDFEKAERFRDVCPLNFTAYPLDKLPLDDIINLDTVNTLLALTNQEAHGKDLTRFELTLKGILA